MYGIGGRPDGNVFGGELLDSEGRRKSGLNGGDAAPVLGVSTQLVTSKFCEHDVLGDGNI